MVMQDVLAWLHRRPFQPFRFHLDDGTAYEVHHPDQVALGTLSLDILVPGIDPAIAEFYETIDLFHITRIQPPPITQEPSGESAE
jgi:hypothetical protein